MAAMDSNRRSKAKVEETAASVNSEALRMLDTDPSEYFRRTHRRVPFGFTAPAKAPKTD